MAQLVVRNLEDSVKTRLQRRAARNGRSMEEEARDILRNALKQEDAPALALGSEIVSFFRRAGLRDAIRELRGHPLLPSAFDR
jgi:antitoxin FitA